MNQIGWGQLGIVLALSRIFAEAANFPRDDITYGMQRFTVVILSYLLLAAVLIPVYVLLYKLPGENIFSAAARKSAAAARVLAVIYLAALFTMMITVTVQLEFYTASTIFDIAPAWLLIAAVLVACLYGTAKGLPTVARAGVIVAGGFAILLILVVLGAADNIRLDFLSPTLAEHPRTLVADVLSEFSKNSEAAVFVSLCSRVRSRPQRSLFLYGGLSLAALLLMTFLYNTILGEYLDVTSFPFYRLSSLSDITLFQRLDGIDAAVWTTSAIIKLSLMTAAAYTAIQSAFGSRRAAEITAISLLALSSLISLWFSRNTVDFITASRLPQTGVIVFAAVTLLPLAGCLFGLARQKKGKGSAK